MRVAIPLNESERLEALHGLGILHTPADDVFDDLAHLAAGICETPIAAVSFVDATSQWFKARLGLSMCSTDRNDAFCAHAILEPRQPFIVPDALLDPRFSDNALVTGGPRIRFYAGIPLVTPDGFAVGSLCVKDVVPRALTPRQLESLERLARQAMQLIQAHRATSELSELKAALAQHAIVATADVAGRIKSVTDRSPALLEVSREIAVGSSAHPALSLFAQAWPAIIAGQVWRGEVSLTAGNGSTLSVQTTVMPMRDTIGRVWQYVAIGTDVTEARQLREAAQRQGAELQALFDLMPAMLWFKDTSNRILRANRCAAEATGKTIAEIEGRPSRELYPQDADRYYADDLEVVRSGVPKLGIVETVRDHTGQARCVRTDKMPYRDHTGQVVGIVVMARDITQKVRDEETLRLLVSAVHCAQDSIIITDATIASPGPRISIVNAAFSALTGYTATEAIGQSPAILQGPLTDATVVKRLKRALRRGIPFRAETINYHKDGRALDLDWQLAPIRDPSGTLSHFVVVLRDISERKTAERELSLAREAAVESSRSKSRFLANMSHELRTPLNAINGLSAMLLEQDQPAATQHALKLILQSGETLLENIQTILTHSSLEAGKIKLDRKPFALTDLVVSALRMAAPRAEAKHLGLDCRIDPQAPAEFLGDPFRLQQILVNLIANAVKFTDQGRVFLRVRAHPLDAERCELRFAIADTGIGIARDKLALLFQPFSQADDSSTRRFEGTGLGLAIAKSLIELMGGRISCSSRPGAGSLFRFSVVLPLTRVRSTVASASHHPRLAGQRVAIQEPDSLRRRELARLASAWGMIIEPASRAENRLSIRRLEADGNSSIIAASKSPTVWLCHTAQPPANVPERNVVLYEPFAPADLSRALALLLKSAPECAPGNARRATKIADRIPLRILAADDTPSNREGMRLICSHLGYSADFAENGAEVLTKIQTTNYDLVLLDVQMPVLDGLATAEEIRRRFPAATRPRLVAVTACAQPSDRDRCLAAGMDEYLSKPIVPRTLITCIESLFRPAVRTNEMAAPESHPPLVPTDATLIDLDHLHALTEGMTEPEAAHLIHTLYAAVKADFANILPRIQKAAADHDSTSLALLVHGMKGSVHSLGWKALAEYCATTLAALRSGTFAEWDDLSRKLSALFSASVAELERTFPPPP